MIEAFLKGYELDLLINIGVSLLAGYVIGSERESKGKPAGVGTHSLVIGGSMIFTFLSALVDPNSTSRIAAQIVSGIGFLGAGVILKGELEGRTDAEIRSKPNKVLNLTTAASIWFSGAIGMAIGFDYHFVALVCVGYFILVSRLPNIKRLKDRISDDE
jgi:putative Mg2+ transporter-C (MgtC) family protein